MAESSWRRRSRQVIEQTNAAHVHLEPRERLKKIRDAYPFGEKENHPYAIWLSEVREWKKRHGFYTEQGPQADGPTIPVNTGLFTEGGA